jgi:hypothetical protein
MESHQVADDRREAHGLQVPSAIEGVEAGSRVSVADVVEGRGRQEIGAQAWGDQLGMGTGFAPDLETVPSTVLRQRLKQVREQVHNPTL